MIKRNYRFCTFKKSSSHFMIIRSWLNGLEVGTGAVVGLILIFILEFITIISWTNILDELLHDLIAATLIKGLYTVSSRCHMPLLLLINFISRLQYWNNSLFGKKSYHYSPIWQRHNSGFMASQERTWTQSQADIADAELAYCFSSN